MSKAKLEVKLAKARNDAESFEFGTYDWDFAMQVVRSLIEEINTKYPAAPWSDKEWKGMMSS